MSRRTEILRRATEVFERQGVNRTSIEDIAKAVGIKREAVYYYFKSRGEILLRILLPQSSRLSLNLQIILGSSMSSRDKLTAAVRNHLESFNPNYLEMAVALREKHVFDDEEKLEELRVIWRDYDRMWVRLVEEGQAAGEFDPRLNPKVAAFGLLGMCNWLSRWYDPAKEIPLEDVIHDYAAMALNGLSCRMPPALAAEASEPERTAGPA